MERWFRTVTLTAARPSATGRHASLDALNRRLWAWVEGEYHQHAAPRPRRATTPLDRWAMTAAEVRLSRARTWTSMRSSSSRRNAACSATAPSACTAPCSKSTPRWSATPSSCATTRARRPPAASTSGTTSTSSRAPRLVGRLRQLLRAAPSAVAEHRPRRTPPAAPTLPGLGPAPSARPRR